MPPSPKSSCSRKRAPRMRCGLERLAAANFGRAARPQLAARQLDDADAQPVLHRLGDRAAAGKLDVVGMRPEENHVDRFQRFDHRLTTLHTSSSCSASSIIRSIRCRPCSLPVAEPAGHAVLRRTVGDERRHELAYRGVALAVFARQSADGALGQFVEVIFDMADRAVDRPGQRMFGREARSLRCG